MSGLIDFMAQITLLAAYMAVLGIFVSVPVILCLLIYTTIRK